MATKKAVDPTLEALQALNEELQKENESLRAQINDLVAKLKEAEHVQPATPSEVPPITLNASTVKRFSFGDAYGTIELIGIEADRFVDGNGVEQVQLCSLPVTSIVPVVDLTISDL